MIRLSSKIGVLIQRSNKFSLLKVWNHSLHTFNNNLIDNEPFDCLLGKCADVISLKKLHALILTRGHGDNIHFDSKLLNCYAKFGFLGESRWVFNIIINRKFSILDSVLVSYFKSGQYNDVLLLYSNLKREKIGMSSTALSFSFKSCCELCSYEFGRGIHADTFKFGLTGHRFVGSSLIGFYAQRGTMTDALKVFDEMADRDVVVYTSIITGCAQVANHFVHRAFDIARKMQNEEVCPNRVTLVSLLQAAGKLGSLSDGRSIHGYAIRRGIGCLDEVFETSLMDMYIKCGVLEIAAHVFGKTKRTIGSCNAMMTAYIQMGQPLDALGLFSEMVQESILLDMITLSNAIICCADLNFLRQGKSIHGHIIRTEIVPDVAAVTALVEMYSRCRSFAVARRLFDRMQMKDVVSYNVLMAGYLENKYFEGPVATFNEMLASRVTPNVGSIVSLLSAFSFLRDVKQGMCVHGYAVKQGFGSNTDISNQVIHMYSQSGCVVDSRKVFDSLPHKDLISWTSMMRGYVDHKNPHEALSLFQNMKRENIAHDSVTMICLILALTQLGCFYQIKEIHCHLYRSLMEKDKWAINSLITTYAKLGKITLAQNLFDSAGKQCISSWNTMIAAQAVHGNCEDSLSLLNQMVKENMNPDKLTLTSILTACSHSGMVEEGLHAFKCMTSEYSVVPCEEHYTCLVDLLSRAGTVEIAYDLVKLLPTCQSSSVLRALLSACILHKNAALGEVVGKMLLDMDPEKSSVYNLLSNFYAEGGKWDEVARLREIANWRGLRKAPGYSLVEQNMQALTT